MEAERLVGWTLDVFAPESMTTTQVVLWITVVRVECGNPKTVAVTNLAPVPEEEFLRVEMSPADFEADGCGRPLEVASSVALVALEEERTELGAKEP